MILVDIYFPSVDKVWDFRVDENAPVSKVIKEILDKVSLKTGTDIFEGATGFRLYSAIDQSEIRMQESLAECGVTDGHRLILV